MLVTVVERRETHSESLSQWTFCPTLGCTWLTCAKGKSMKIAFLWRLTFVWPMVPRSTYCVFSHHSERLPCPLGKGSEAMHTMINPLHFPCSSLPHILPIFLNSGHASVLNSCWGIYSLQSALALCLVSNTTGNVPDVYSAHIPTWLHVEFGMCLSIG